MNIQKDDRCDLKEAIIYLHKLLKLCSNRYIYYLYNNNVVVT